MLTTQGPNINSNKVAHAKVQIKILINIHYRRIVGAGDVDNSDSLTTIITPGQLSLRNKEFPGTLQTVRSFHLYPTEQILVAKTLNACCATGVDCPQYRKQCGRRDDDMYGIDFKRHQERSV
jgi:hypothetical protein